jgi:hypothetical protein
MNEWWMKQRRGTSENKENSDISGRIQNDKDPEVEKRILIFESYKFNCV